MATDSRNILNFTGSDADFRTYAQGVHDMLVAAGLTQTTDTGQVNIGTLARPASGNTVAGFEVFRFNDTEQATLGCFVRVEYCSSSASITIPGIRFIVGTGTNGAGVLSNSFTPPNIQAWSSTVDSAAQVRPAFASYAEGQLSVNIAMDPAGGRGIFFYAGRPRLYDGTRTTDGLLILFGSRSGVGIYGHTVIRAGGGGPGTAGTTLNELPVMDSLGGWDDQVGANVGLYPVNFAVNGNLRFGSIFSYRAAAIASDTQQAISVFGANRNYRTLGGVALLNDASLAVPFF